MKVENIIRRVNVLTIDVDLKDLHGSKSEKVLMIEAMLFNLLHMFNRVYIRESSSGKGFHITIDVDEEAVKWIREMYDDKKRVKIDEERRRLGMRSGRFLWFKKGKKKAEGWVELSTSQDVERYVREYFVYEF